MWLINLIGITNYSLKSGDKNLDNNALLYESFKRRYAKVTVLKKNDFEACGIKTLGEVLFSSYSSYFVLESTDPLSAIFEYDDADGNPKIFSFEIPSGRNIYQTFINGNLLVKSRASISKKVIIGTDVKRYKIEKYGKGRYKEDKNLLYRHDYALGKEDFGKWIEAEWYYSSWILQEYNKIAARDRTERITSKMTAKFNEGNIYAIGIYTENAVFTYFKIKGFDGKFKKLENGSEAILIEQIVEGYKKHEIPIRKCYKFPSGELFLKWVYQGKRLGKGDKDTYVDIYEQANPFTE